LPGRFSIVENDGGSQMSNEACFVIAGDQGLSYADNPVLPKSEEINHKIEVDSINENAMEYGA